ncbi:MAG: YbhB/YbcL family Raf kinase inhibitor-like protein [Methanospirillum sp.]|nr:YbhB/YbcL family Raf kinase inhibitor-like protein [Methanospirillum sp.]
MKPLAVRLPITHFPPNYTCDGTDISPAIEIRDLEHGTRSLALILLDPDAPGGNFVHWLCWNMEVVTTVPENIPKEPETTFPVAARQGTNDFDRIGYGGPCPPHGHEHRYDFKVYALDTLLDLAPGARLPDLNAAMQGHVLQYGDAQAVYGR